MRNPEVRVAHAADPPAEKPKFYYDRNDEIVFARRHNPIFHVRVRTLLPDDGRSVEMFNGSLRPLPPLVHSSGIWEWELEPGLYKYGRAGGPYEICELIGEGREIDVQL